MRANGKVSTPRWPAHLNGRMEVAAIYNFHVLIVQQAEQTPIIPIKRSHYYSFGKPRCNPKSQTAPSNLDQLNLQAKHQGEAPPQNFGPTSFLSLFKNSGFSMANTHLQIDSLIVFERRLIKLSPISQNPKIRQVASFLPPSPLLSSFMSSSEH